MKQLIGARHLAGDLRRRRRTEPASKKAAPEEDDLPREAQLNQLFVPSARELLNPEKTVYTWCRSAWTALRGPGCCGAMDLKVESRFLQTRMPRGMSFAEDQVPTPIDVPVPFMIFRYETK